MRSLPILWKRLVKEGATCPRCGSTHENVVSAVKKLEAALQPLGIEPVLETLAIDETSFQADPSSPTASGSPASRWRNGWCPRRCKQMLHRSGDLPCRTMEIDGQHPQRSREDLIVRAAMMAASA